MYTHAHNLQVFHLAYQVLQHWSDLDNMCTLELYELEGCEQHEYSLCRHRFNDYSVEGYTQVNLSGLSELAGEKGGGVVY